MSYAGICAFDQAFFLSDVYRFTLAETVLYQSTKFGFLDVSADNILGKVGPDILGEAIV